MDNCCQEIQDIKCSVNNISQRIIPIQYIDDKLVIEGTVVIGSLTANNFTANNFIVNNLVPSANNTYNIGSSTNWFSNIYVNEIYTSSIHVDNAQIKATGDILELPLKTTINGWPVLNTEYFHFFTNYTTPFPSDRYILIGSTTSTGNVETRCFPFVAPETCVITSLMFSFAIGASGSSSITDATAFIDLIDTNGNVYYGLQSVIISSCPLNTKNYKESTFELTINKGDSIGIYIQYTGSTTATSNPCVILGYRQVKPTPVFLINRPIILSGHFYPTVSLENNPYQTIYNNNTSLQNEPFIKKVSYGNPMSEEDFLSRKKKTYCYNHSRRQLIFQLKIS